MKAYESPLRDLARLIVWYPVRCIIPFLPVNLVFLLAKILSALHTLMFRKSYKRIKANMHYALSRHNSSLSYSENSFKFLENHYRYRLMLFMYSKFRQKGVDSLVSVEGLEKIKSALNKGKGCIILTGHYGPAQLILFALGLKEYRIGQLSYRPKNRHSFIGEKVALRLRLKFEEYMPAEIIEVETFLRPAFKMLKSNNLLTVNGDGIGLESSVGKHIDIRFLDKMVSFPLGPHALASKTGATVLPVFVISDGKARYKVVVEDEIKINKAEDRETGSRMFTESFARILEGYVLRSPHMWHFWDRFREGELIRNDLQSPEGVS